jgi:C4-dicarboxylate transporter
MLFDIAIVEVERRLYTKDNKNVCILKISDSHFLKQKKMTKKGEQHQSQQQDSKQKISPYLYFILYIYNEYYEILWNFYVKAKANQREYAY